MAVNMRKFETYILVACLASTAIITTKLTFDCTLTVKYLPWAACIIVLFLCTLKTKIDWSIFDLPLIAALGAYVVISALSIFWAQNKAEGVYETYKASLVLTSVVLFASMKPDKKILIKWMVFLAIGLSLYGIYQFFTTESRFFRWGTMGHKNLFAAALLLLLRFCVYASRNKSLLGTLAAGLVLFNILTLQTRSVFVALFVAAMVCSLRKLRHVVVSLVFFVIIGLTIYAFRGPGIFNSGTLKERSDLTKWSVSMIKDHPFGVGAGNWKLEIPAYNHNYHPENPKGRFTKYYQRPHNDFMLAISETGIGGVFYILVFVIAIFCLLRSRDEFAMTVLFALICCIAYR